MGETLSTHENIFTVSYGFFLNSETYYKEKPQFKLSLCTISIDSEFQY